MQAPARMAGLFSRISYHSKMSTIESVLERVRSGELDIADAATALRDRRVESLEFATIDHDRADRCGVAEIIFGQGKTPEQVVGVARALRRRGCVALATRLGEAHAAALREAFGDDDEVSLGPLGRVAMVGTPPTPAPHLAPIPIVTAGTSDLPVAEEALFTCRALGHPVHAIDDVGVAGLHRLLRRLDEVRRGRVVIVIAGMEGALPSVVAGLIDAPVIAVPTSVGYGASFGGLSALLGMLNTCAAGVTVVNIDNGFGAAYAACKINALAPARPD